LAISEDKDKLFFIKIKKHCLYMQKTGQETSGILPRVMAPSKNREYTFE
jgi:hypothetical protein